MLDELYERVSAHRHGPRSGPRGRVRKSPEERLKVRGHGNWACWEEEDLDLLLRAAKSWSEWLPEGDKYWLCWCNDDAWCRMQQKLVLSVGWTPVVGYDLASRAPVTVLEGAIAIPFHQALPPMRNLWMHFPLEFAFVWVKRLAFWHSDVLLPRAAMREYARQFEALDGAVTAAVFSRRNLLRPTGWNNADRWFELIGCTTAEASYRQFVCGGGWWRHFQNHPYCPPVRDLHRYNWDHGGGIRYWQRVHGGKIERLRFDSRNHVSHYHRPDLRGLGEPLARVDLPKFARELEIADWLDG